MSKTVRPSLPSRETLSASLLAGLAEQLASPPEQIELPPRTWTKKPHQVRPDDPHSIWMLIGGRGCGKTRCGAEHVLEHLRTFGPRARVGIGAPTFQDARDVCAEGESGLITLGGPEFTTWNRTFGEARHVLGGYVKFLGSEEPSRWNGPQWTMLWADELALWKSQDSFNQALFGLRLGAEPWCFVSTTPKANRWLRVLSQREDVQVTRGTTFDNADNLAASAVSNLEQQYGGTTLGRQELLGEWVEDLDGALWTRAWIDGGRVVDIPEGVTLRRVVVAIDPAMSTKAKNCETGLCVAGVGSDNQYYVLRSEGLRASPDTWARRAVALYEAFHADRILAEVNNGGDLVEATLRRVSSNLPYRKVHASRGKAVRAEPVAALYEQGKVHHVGTELVTVRGFSEVEDQMCRFPVDDSAPKDRLDALVWALTELSGRGVVDRSAYRIPVRRHPLPPPRGW